MIFEITLSRFYSRGDERRLFQGLNDISAIENIQGVGKNLLLTIKVNSLNKGSMRELLALLWRYGIPLMPLRSLAEKTKFSWLNDEQGYWYGSMFNDN